MKKAVFEYKSEAVTLQNGSALSPIPHFHKEVEMIFIKKGSCDAYADRECIHLETDDLFISFPNQIHYYENSVFGEYKVIIVNSNLFFDLKEILYNFTPAQNKINLKEYPQIKELLIQVSATDSKFRNTMLVGILNYSMSLLLHEIALKPRIKTDNSTLQLILDFCTENFTEDITLDDVSDNLHLSKYHVSHLLSQKLGINFSSYINMLRIDKACDLLRETNNKTADISEEVGFGSIRSFNRAFIKITNLTPIKYRNRYKMQNNM